MSQNLVEFLKVLTIVVGWSTLILVGRRAMISLDEQPEADTKEFWSSIVDAIKVGDLVEHVGRYGVGLIIESLPFNGFIVLFTDGSYRMNGNTLNLLQKG